MPEVNIPAEVRFWLYLLAAVALAVTPYLVDTGLIGQAEDDLVIRLAALLNVLAAAKTDRSAGRRRRQREPVA